MVNATSRTKWIRFIIGFVAAATVTCAPKSSYATVTLLNPTELQNEVMILPAGAKSYIFGCVTGGGAPGSGFAFGNIATATDNNGYMGAALAFTNSSSNNYDTQDTAHSMCGIGISAYATEQSYFNSYNVPGIVTEGSGAYQVTVDFTLDQPEEVVVVGLASSQQQVSLSGLPGLNVDCQHIDTGDGWEGSQIADTFLPAGNYTAIENSFVESAGQNTYHMSDLIGVFAFTDVPEPTCLGMIFLGCVGLLARRRHTD